MKQLLSFISFVLLANAVLAADPKVTAEYYFSTNNTQDTEYFSAYQVRINVFSDNTMSFYDSTNYQGVTGLKRDKKGDYVSKIKDSTTDADIEVRLTINENWNTVTLAQKNLKTQAVTTTEYPRLNKLQGCTQINNLSVCAGDIFAGDDTFKNSLSSSAGRILNFFVKLNGEIDSVEFTSDVGQEQTFGDLRNIKIFAHIQKVNTNVPCVKSVCIGQKYQLVFRDGEAVPFELIGFSEGTVVINPLVRSFITFDDNKYVALGQVSLAGFDRKFEKIVNQSCDDLSLNQQKQIFDQAAAAANQLCAQETPFSGCSARKYCGAFGCGYENWVESVSPKQCRIYGYTQPVIRSPF